MDKDFNYKEFAQNMKEQCIELVPKEFCQKDKEFIINTIYNYTLLAAEALCSDENLNLDSETKIIITQLIAEWTFHKSCELIRERIHQKYRDTVLQKIAFTIFETAKQGYIKKLPREDILTAVEHHVNKAYKEALEALCNKKAISEEDVQYALSFSNIDKIAEENKEQQQDTEASCQDVYAESTKEIKKERPNLGKILVSIMSNFFVQFAILMVAATYTLLYLKAPSKILTDISAIGFILGVLAAIIGGLLNYIDRNTNKFYKITTKIISWICILITFILTVIAAYLIITTHTIPWLQVIPAVIMMLCTLKNCVDIEINEQLDRLAKVKSEMEDLKNPDKMYEKLGVDIIEVQVGTALLPIADPDMDGQLYYKFTVLRGTLTDELGYIIPSIRIRDNDNLDEYEYRINIRGSEAGSGFVYPDRYMVIASEWDNTEIPFPEDAIIGVEPTYRAQCCWIKENDLPKAANITAVKAEDVIIAHLKEILIDNVDSILSTTDITKYLSLCEAKEPYIINSLSQHLAIEDIRKIFVNLIQERVAIKDLPLLFDRLNDFSRFSTSPDILSEKLRTVFARSICLNYCTIDKVLYTVTISDNFEKILSKNIEDIDQNRVLNLNPGFVKDFVEKTAIALMNAHKTTYNMPVVLCSPEIRLPLYRLLKKHIPNIVVISNNELIDGIKIENAGQIA